MLTKCNDQAAGSRRNVRIKRPPQDLVQETVESFQATAVLVSPAVSRPVDRLIRVPERSDFLRRDLVLVEECLKHIHSWLGTGNIFQAVNVGQTALGDIIQNGSECGERLPIQEFQKGAKKMPHGLGRCGVISAQEDMHAPSPSVSI